jgi:hypothetical protein
MRKFWFVALFFAAFSTLLSAQTHTAPTPDHKDRVLQDYGKLPLSFEANQGQTDENVKFLSRGSGYSLFLTSNEAVLAFGKTAPTSSRLNVRPGQTPVERQKPTTVETGVVRMQLADAKSAPRLVGEEQLPGKVNYFLGNDPLKWRTNLPTYGKVKYEDVYPGVDLVYYGNEGHLEYDFVVSPGADSRSIRIRFHGAKKLRIDSDGNLWLEAGDRRVSLEKPQAFQEAEGRKKTVECEYRLIAANTVGIRVGDFDQGKTLVIDPVLAYSTYLGGSGSDLGTSVAVDSFGNAYVTGTTDSQNFPTANAREPKLSGSENVFVTKINASGTAVVYSTYLGGSGDDVGESIAVDGSGNAYVTGDTSSQNFPTVNALQRTHSGGFTDAFVTKISSSGAALDYSTYLGGSSEETGTGIAVDTSGNAYITGFTQSPNFPTANALQPTYGGGFIDAFVAKIDASGTALVYSTYLGGIGEDYGSSIAVDASRDVYVTGYTTSSNFPTEKPLQPSLAGFDDAFITKINASGTALVYSTYLGGDQSLQPTIASIGYGIAVDASRNAYVTGFTTSSNFPIEKPLQPAMAGFQNAFITKINASGSALVYSTYLGGSHSDIGRAIAVDALGNADVVGTTSSMDFPTTNALRKTYGGGFTDAFVARISASGTALVYSTYLGGSGEDTGLGVAVDHLGNAYVAGATSSGDFPMAKAFQPTYGGGDEDAFISKISSCTAPPVVTVSADPTMLWPPNGKMVPVTVSGAMTDACSAVKASTAEYSVVDEYGEVQPSGPVTLGAGERYSFTILLEASRLGSDKNGRTYTIKVSAKDDAGHLGSGSTVVTVPHDQGH